MLLWPLPCCRLGRAASLVATKAQEMQTFCFGRHQMELPEDFELAMGASSIFTPPGLTSDDAKVEVTIRASNATANAFKALVDKRQAKIVADADTHTDVLKELIAVSKDAIIFRIQRIKASYTSELHLLKGGIYLTASSKSYNNHYAQAETRLLAFAGHVEPATGANVAPTAFCLGPVLVKGQYVGEYARFRYRGKTYPDVAIELELDTYAPDESESLLQRVEGDTSLLGKFSAGHKVLRKGELTVAGMRAQEWLGAIRQGEQGDRKQYGFAVETMRSTPSSTQPRMHLDFDSGQKGRDGAEYATTLTDQQAIELWDGVVKSIRSRP